MQPTQIRGDTHLGNNGRFTRVISRKNHIFSTNVTAKLDYKLTVLAKPSRDPLFDAEVPQPSQLEPALILDDTLDVNVDDLVVNKTHTKSSIRPNASVNGWDHSPRDRAILLPYLCEDLVRKNATIGAKSSAETSRWLLNGADAALGDYPPSFSDDTIETSTIWRAEYAFPVRALGKMFCTVNTVARPARTMEDVYARGVRVPRDWDPSADRPTTHVFRIVTYEMLSKMNASFPTSAMPVDDQDQIGLESLRLAFDEELAKSEKRLVYRTDNRDFYLTMSAREHFQVGGEDDFKNFRGYFSFPLRYDIEIEFGRDGLATTRAVNFAGDDISEQVRFGDFFRMDVWKTGERHSSRVQVSDEDEEKWDTVANVSELGDNTLAQTVETVSLFLPIRRYTFTHRQTPADMLPIVSSGPRNLLITTHAENDNYRFRQSFLTKSYTFFKYYEKSLLGISSQERMIDLYNSRADIKESLEVEFNTLDVGEGMTLDYNNNGTNRQVIGLKIPVNTEAADFILYNRDGKHADEYAVVAFRLAYEYEEAASGAVKANLANHNGWYPYNGDPENVDNVYDPDGQDSGGHNPKITAVTEDKFMYVFYRDDDVDVDAEYLTFLPQCKLLFSGRGQKNAQTRAILYAEHALSLDHMARLMTYDDPENNENVIATPNNRGLDTFLPDPFEINEDAVTIGGGLFWDPGRAKPLFDGFEAHPPAGVEPDGSGAFLKVRNAGAFVATDVTYGTIANDFPSNMPGYDASGALTDYNAIQTAFEAFDAVRANLGVLEDQRDLLEEQILALQQEFNTLTATLEALQDELDDIELGSDEYTAKQEEIDNQEALINAKQDEITAKQRDLAFKQAEVDVADGTDLGIMLARNTHYGILWFETKTQVIVTKNDELDVLQNNREDLVTDRTVLVQQRHTVLQPNALVADNNVAPWNAKIAEATRLSNLGSPTPVEAAQLALLQAELTEAAATVTALQNAKAAADQALEDNNDEIEAQDLAIAAADALIAAKFTEIDTAEEIVEAIADLWYPVLGQDSSTARFYMTAENYLIDWEMKIATDLIHDLPETGANYDKGWQEIAGRVQSNYVDEVYGGQYYTDIYNFLVNYQRRNAFDWVKEGVERVLTQMKPVAFQIKEGTIHTDQKHVIRRCVGTVTFEETLLSIGGASTFNPSTILPIIPEFNPLFQDFEFANADFAKFYRTDRFCEYQDVVGLFEPSPESHYSLSTKSKNVFNQEDKSLQSISIPVPDFETFRERFTRTDVENARYVVPFSTVQGPPDWVFIYVERAFTNPRALYTRYPIQIKSVQIEVMKQDIPTLSTLSEFRLLEATRRNSDLRSDQRELQLTTGGLLLSKDDFVKFYDFKKLYGAKDQLQGQFVVRAQDLRFKPIGYDDQINREVRALLDEYEFDIVVQFIYSDHILEGEAGTMRFRQLPTRMGKLEMDNFN